MKKSVTKYLYLTKDEIKIEIAAEHVGCTIDVFRKAVEFWRGHNVLDIIGDFVVSDQITKERLEYLRSLNTGGFIAEESMEIVAMQVVSDLEWNAIFNIIKNQDPEKADSKTIHTLVTMYVPDVSYNLIEFEEVLGLLVSQDKLENDGTGTYSLHPNAQE